MIIHRETLLKIITGEGATISVAFGYVRGIGPDGAEIVVTSRDQKVLPPQAESYPVTGYHPQDFSVELPSPQLVDGNRVTFERVNH